MRLWEENVKRFAPQAERLVLAVDGADPKLTETPAILLNGNLGNYMELIERKKPYLYQGCTMQFLALAMLAHVNECDFIYQEQDCLCFGDYTQALYAACGDKGMCVGRMPGEWAAVALFLVRHHFILRFVKWWLNSPYEIDRNQLSEIKMGRLAREMPEEVAFHGMGPERQRPFDAMALPFYLQQVSHDDIEKLRQASLV